MDGLPSLDALHLEVDENGIATMTLDNPPVNTVGITGHRELTYVWPALDQLPEVRCVLIRANGRAFSAGGDFELLEHIRRDPRNAAAVMTEAGDLVRNMIDFSKPVVSAINGVAVGAGLAAALLADVPVAGRSARLLDGHVSLGVAAGDHAVVLWPLLIGMAKAKYHLLTNEPIDGVEAERLGLVSLVVDDDDLQATARRVAERLAAGSRSAISWTKKTLNHWLRAAYPAFDASLAHEFLGFLSPDVEEGIAAVREKRAPRFEEG